MCVQALLDLKKLESKNMELQNKFVELAALSALKLEIPQALEFCTQSYHLHKDSIFHALNLAKALFLAQDYAEATKLLEELVKMQHSLQKECLELFIEVYKAQNLLENAESMYCVLLQHAPKEWQRWLECGDMYFYNAPKKALEVYSACYKVAREVLDELVKNAPFVEIPQTCEPDSLTARFNSKPQIIENPEITQLKIFLNTNLEVRIAQILLNLFEKPKQEAQQALEILINLQAQNTNNDVYWLAFARALEYTGYYAQAEQAYRRIFTIPNVNAHNLYIAHFWLAYLLMRQNRFSEALESYEYRLCFASNNTFSPLHYSLAKEAFCKILMRLRIRKFACIVSKDLAIL
ncbi:hypothetical protein BCM35_02175 [Helicobacter winghamensis]|uniref:Tetratricopeptide repeat protein n=1 Tax=Helicobacter winghamensis TaxID=157268 RepID=A0A2N3PJW9_9HELI|nr:hypothetical protein BCM32_02760 [Helicobacter winghamensis]PKT77483.1 hypothetical protein BCM34_00825 [Helicobacter winghamensis]PKT77784.1 hypothetical protein BCM35_02175 [Helicobacter winghamensis]PKT81449.1 hypothetical protein BCM31_07235 [Helicobacter winghamensis]PKT81626.1 hypothetical protein BCM33_02155 [Helicobacter winghamensis]